MAFFMIKNKSLYLVSADESSYQMACNVKLALIFSKRKDAKEYMNKFYKIGKIKRLSRKEIRKCLC